MYERMLDKQTPPTREEMAAVCGETGALFAALNEKMERDWSTQTSIRFPYGKNYGWGVEHRKKNKHVCDVFAENGAFTVMVRLKDEQFFEVYPQLSPYAQGVIDRRYPCGDGGWIHYRVTTPEQARDIAAILKRKLQG